jgi:hypothetical protein
MLSMNESWLLAPGAFFMSCVVVAFIEGRLSGLGNSFAPLIVRTVLILIANAGVAAGLLACIGLAAVLI